MHFNNLLYFAIYRLSTIHILSSYIILLFLDNSIKDLPVQPICATVSQLKLSLCKIDCTAHLKSVSRCDNARLILTLINSLLDKKSSKILYQSHYYEKITGKQLFNLQYV